MMPLYLNRDIAVVVAAVVATVTDKIYHKFTSK